MLLADSRADSSLFFFFFFLLGGRSFPPKPPSLVRPEMEVVVVDDTG